MIFCVSCFLFFRGGEGPHEPVLGHKTLSLFVREGKHIDINNLGDVPGLGGWPNVCVCVCVCARFFFLGSSLWGRKTHKLNPSRNPGTILRKHCCVFFSSVFLLLPSCFVPRGRRLLCCGTSSRHVAKRHMATSEL